MEKETRPPRFRFFILTPSQWAVSLSLLLVCFTRFAYYSDGSRNGYNATSWDAFGYYLYLPGLFIYGDVDKLAWVEKVDSTYHVTGGYYYQATALENGNRVCKYLGGVALMELPFFGIAHIAAGLSGYPQDGFSAPYQYAVLWAAIFWFFIGLLYLRKVLLLYYSEQVTAITLLLVLAATNLLQYVAVSGSMSHAFIFPLYAMILFYSARWSREPRFWYAALIGIILGLATLSRPTELIMLFIPFFWLVPENPSFKAKWNFLLRHKMHLVFAAFGFALTILPQLVYWKFVTGSWVYDVGSKWYFLNPWWRVLFGFEKGWFIYTPITILFIVGLFCLKAKPFRLAVIVFALLNIWIVISWHEWQYGASYSTRALTQSYPVFALAFAAVLERIADKRLRWISGIVFAYLLLVNLVQIWQYNKTILHYSDMNARYYRAVYLNLNPDPLDFSLMDTDEQMSASEQSQLVQTSSRAVGLVDLKSASTMKLISWVPGVHQNVDFQMDLYLEAGRASGQIIVQAYHQSAVTKERRFRLNTPGAEQNAAPRYEHHFFIPAETDSVVWTLESFGEMHLEKATVMLRVPDANK